MPVRSPMIGAAVSLAGLVMLFSPASIRTRAAESPSSPMSVQQESASFRLADPNLTIELVAAEPDVISPVAIAFDADGRMFVAEMSDYPAGPVSGRIKLLEDRDGDGHYERVTVFADNLAFPNGVLPWRGGVLVTAAPDIWFLRDTDGDGRADERRVVLTGFGQGNQQLRVNSLTWGLDNWIYGANGRSEGEVRWADRAGEKAVSIRGRDFRFRPESHQFEAIAGRSQFGLARDDWGNRFLSWNTIPMRHDVLPERYLARGPHLTVTRSLADIFPADDLKQVFPLTPPPLVFNDEPFGFFNASCGLTIYRGDALEKKYRGNAFVCEPLRNLVHRRILTPSGVTFVAQRGEQGTEFLASSDPWFHPVNLATGPDGALYVVDFYRRFVEHPDFVSDAHQKKTVAWRTGAEHGRIWRIREKHSPLKRHQRQPGLSRADVASLVSHLSDQNGWWRDTAQRLLVERQDQAAVPRLKKLLQEQSSTAPRLHALHTLDGLHALTPEILTVTLKDAQAAVREHSIRLSEQFIGQQVEMFSGPTRVQRASGLSALSTTLMGMTDDADSRVRFQLALSLGEMAGGQNIEPLSRLAQTGVGDAWQSLAILSSAGARPWLLLRRTAEANPGWLRSPTEDQAHFLERLAMLAGASGHDADAAECLAWLPQCPSDLMKLGLLAGFADGVTQGNKSLRQWRLDPPPALRSQIRALDQPVKTAVESLTVDDAPLRLRLAAIRVLARIEPAAGEKVLPRLLLPQSRAEAQTAAIKAVGELNDAELTAAVFAQWSLYSKSVRRGLAAAAPGSSEMTKALLEALEQGRMLPVEIEPSTQQSLRKVRDAQTRARVEKVFQVIAAPDREQVVRQFEPALQLVGDRRRGAAVFARSCALCHSIQGQGNHVGPDLSGIASHSKETLLVDIFDPSRQVSPDYVNYTLVTSSGEIATGFIAAESATSITLRRANEADTTVPRSRIKELKAEGKSLMPDGLEQGMTSQEVADLLEFLLHPDKALIPETK